MIATILVCVLGVVFFIPNLLSDQQRASLPDVLANSTIGLGLDLRGGSYLLLEVETDAVIFERLETAEDDVRQALRSARIAYSGLASSVDGVTFTLRDPAQIAEVEELMDEVALPVQQAGFGGATFGAAAQPDLTVDVTPEGSFTITMTPDAIDARVSQAVTQSLEIVRRRIDETGTLEPVIQRQGLNRILVQLPGIDDPDRIKALLGQTAKLTFQLVDPAVDPFRAAQTNRVPPGSELMFGEDVNADGQADPYVIRRRAIVSGEMLTDAQPQLSQGQWAVLFTFDRDGTRRFAETTRNNVGRPFAIILDGEVVSAPVIREPITGGQGQITGNFSAQEATDLALLLRAGALPAPLNVVEERTVGPSLGADSIAAGEIAGAVSIVLVLLYMIASYGRFGVFASMALTLNIILIGAALSVLPATLTLPGIAGIVLTVGMAVDANVLVFERIREEIAAGKSSLAAVDIGYQRAMTSILDANITTLIAALLLYVFGSGPVRGFSVTLAIGIMTSVFTAILLTRLFVVTYMQRSKPKTLKL